jgi:alkylation response protein AidB-like acyl-CoA dehydrogenase
MDLAPNEDQRALRDLARQILTDLVTADRLKEAEGGPDHHDPSLWAELARAGLLGVGVPAELGGNGGGMAEACLLLEEQGRTVAPVPLLPTLVLGAMPIAEFGTQGQRDQFLRGVPTGDVVLTAALDADGGDPTVRAEGSAGGWSLTGVVDAVPAVTRAAGVLVPATTPDGPRAFLVNAGSATLEAQTGTSREPRFRVRLDAVRGEPVGEDGAPGLLDWLMPRAVVATCAIQVGVSERALRMTAEYVSGREQFGKPLGAFQAVQQRLADAYVDVEIMRWTMWQAAWKLDEGLPAGEEVAVAKAWAAEGGQRVAATAQHLHGGIGVDVEYPLHRYTLWAKDLELRLGSGTRHLARLGALLAAGAER